MSCILARPDRFPKTCQVFEKGSKTMKRSIIFLTILTLFLLACNSLPRPRERATAVPATPLPAAPTKTLPPPGSKESPAPGAVEALSGGGARLSTGDGLSLTLAADGQITAVTLDGDPLPIAPAPPLVVRDLTQAGADDAPNLLPNPGFESGQSGWSPLAASRVDVNVVNQTARSGSRALEIRSWEEGGRGAIISDPIPVTPDGRYRISGYFQIEFGYVDESGVPTFWQDDLYDGERMITGLYLQWLDAAGTPLSKTPQLAAALHWNAQTWRKISRELTAPPEAAAAQIIAGAKPVSGAVWVDDLVW
ncbi:MAG TPA: hypothetical protein ENK32_03330, partial [Anaerolineae bacterium]|nr:hypothetical protein [Anaerolineae bacterium]